MAAALAPRFSAAAESIPLPEHPRPDFERAEWLNLNGAWAFRFDKENSGEKEAWQTKGLSSFPQKITVPFPWGSQLSGVGNDADIGWYARSLRVPDTWRGKRVFLVIGAADWRTSAWLDGAALGSHRGGYTPFAFELTPHVSPGKDQVLVLRIDDAPRPFQLEGKQGYGPARGIWQTIYLEARPSLYIDGLRFLPDIDAGAARVEVRLSEPAPVPARVTIRSRDGSFPEASAEIARGVQDAALTMPIPGPRLWRPEDPFLYHVDAVLGGGVGKEDRVGAYFGMRKIGVLKLPGTDHSYVALNGKPFYFQMALDQAYHPDGFYTFPSDQFLREEVLRALRIGLNAIRIHVKIEMPRKLYWADRLGLLVMADVPNSWGEPDEEMRRETDTALRGMIARDFNHPSIFSWVVFNETWGLKTKDRGYTSETQEWVASMYRLAKSLDPTRLVEDNSPCNYDHVETDINTWHAYLPGYAWRQSLADIVRDTRPGSKWNYIGERTQGEQPLMNSECGNVWGYKGSTGDVDWSWDYHLMLNEFRRQPKVCGWLYTEFHDVINEWNGYYKFDRTPKVTGLGALAPGMSLRDLHAPFYLAPGPELCAPAKPGETVQVPLWASFLTDVAPGGGLLLRWELAGWDGLGRDENYGAGERRLEFAPWLAREIEPLAVTLPAKRALAILRLALEDATGRVLHRNFTTFLVGDGPAPRDETIDLGGEKARVLRFAPASHRAAEWSLGRWEVPGGLKVNGAGHGFFEYALPWPEGLDAGAIAGASFRAELGAKQLFTKDRKDAGEQQGDFMRGRGTLDGSLNPNAYPMTDGVPFPSAVRIRVNGAAVACEDLPDDPADHRGILSWYSQKREADPRQLREGRLHEAGSYGYLVAAAIPAEALRAAAAAKEIVVRLEVDPALPGGLAVYGERFGRYPLDPTLVFHLRQ
jgi:hypothetical protein